MTTVAVSSKIVEQYGNKLFRVVAVEMNGKRDSMEDSHAVALSDNFGFFGVFDGHAGNQCAQFCSAQFKEAVLEEKFLTPVADKDFSDMCISIDQKFLASAENDPLAVASDSGCTGAFMFATPISEKPGLFDLQIGNVGDSRVIVGNVSGHCLLATEDHKPNLDGELARIQASGGRVKCGKVNGMLAVSRAFGDIGFKSNRRRTMSEQMLIAQPDISHVEIQEGIGFALVICDGILEQGFSNESVVGFVSERLASGLSEAEIVIALCDEALSKGSKDNMTAVLVCFGDGSAFTKAQWFIPGPFISSNDQDFWRAYCGMVTLAGISVGKCLALRYEILLRDISRLIGSDTHCDELVSLKNELLQYGDGPPQNIEEDARIQWFEKLVHQWQRAAFPAICGDESDSD